MSEPDEIARLRAELAELKGQLAQQGEVSARQGSAAVGGDANGAVITIHPPPPGPAPEEQLAFYYRHLLAECRQLPLGVIDPKLFKDSEAVSAPGMHEVYVDLDIRQRAPRADAAAEAAREQDREPLLKALEREGRAVLLGDPGSGKTTFVNWLSARLAAIAAQVPAQDPEELPDALSRLLPVRLILREVAAAHIPAHAQGKAALLWRALQDDLGRRLHAGAAGRMLEHLQARIRDQGALFFLDGLDEVPEGEGRRQALLGAVRELAETWSHCRFLITARPYAYDQPANRLRGFEVLELAPFSEEQRDRFIERWYATLARHNSLNQATAEGKARSLQQAAARPNLAELAQRPLLLTLMAALHSSRGRLPEDRAKLYDESVELLLGGWQRGRLVRGTDGAYVADVSMAQVLDSDLGGVHRAMEDLAFQVHQRQRGEGRRGPADIRKGELLEAFDPLLNHAECRFKSSALLDYLGRHAGLLIARDEDGPFAFPHRSFQEYLAACHVCRRTGYPKRFRALLEQDPAWWREVFLLGVGQAGEGNLEPLLTQLLPRDIEKVAQPGDLHWRLAALVGDALVEQQVKEKLAQDEAYQALYERAQGWLTALLERGALSAAERAEVGDSLGRLGDPRPGVGLNAEGLPDIAWVELPGGTFPMGEGKQQHRVAVAAFRIARYPVTVAQYAAFIEDGGYDTEQWWTRVGWAWRSGELDTWEDAKEWAWWLQTRPPEQRGLPLNWREQQGVPNQPVRFVTWFEAFAFCRWLAARSDLDIRLPSEAEWEYAAAGVEGRRFPWGNSEWDESRANVEESELKRVVAVGLYPAGATPEGIHDLAGNLWEWCLSAYAEYPYTAACDNPETKGRRVLHGGVYYSSAKDARCAYRGRYNPDNGDYYIGFRVVAVPGEF